MFQPRGHPGFYPLSSLVQTYIQLGRVAREYGDGDMVENIMKVIREQNFRYDRFADQVVKIELVFRGSLMDSFSEVFQWVSVLLISY